MDDSENYVGIDGYNRCITRNILFNPVFSDLMKQAVMDEEFAMFDHK